jgi:hypothetical membrane protein
MAEMRTLGKNPTDLERAGILFFLSAAEFLMLDTIAESLDPGYNIGKNFLSDLGAAGSSTFYLWNGMLLSFGIIWILGAFFLSRSNRVQGGMKPTAICYSLVGVGTIIASLSPDNVNAIIQSIGATMAFVFGGVSALLTFRFTTPPFRIFSLTVGIIVLTLFALMLFGIDFGLGAGGIERAILYPELIWAISLGGYFLGSSRV